MEMIPYMQTATVLSTDGKITAYSHKHMWGYRSKIEMHTAKLSVSEPSSSSIEMATKICNCINN
jgi:hypothetical protein